MNGMNGGDGAVVTERAETMSGLSREERRRKRKELKVELEKLKREIRRVDIKLAEAKKGGKGAKKQTSAGGRGGKGNSKLYSVGGETLVSPDYKQRGVKRKQSGVGASQPESKESRKAAMLKERGRRVQSLWGQCATILKQLKQNRNAWPFHKPVDWRNLNIPDYPNIVKNPMDMQTVADKLGGFDAKCKETQRDYKSPLEFRDDLRLIFDNCRLYNPVGSDVRIMGDALADLFEKKWQNSNIEGKFAMELEYQKKEEEDLKNFVPSRGGGGKQHKSGGQMSSQMQHLESELSRMKQTSMGGKKGSSKALDDPNAEMSFEDKRKLSVNLGLLSAEKLVKVVQIINEGPNKLNDNDDEEIELDIDSLDNQTLWRLEKYTTSCLKGSKKASHQDKIQRMQQQQEETARKLEDVNATLASRSAGAADRNTTDFSPVSSKRQAAADHGSDSSDSESESAEGVGSDGDMKKNSSFAGDVTRVSTTRPQSSQPQILKDTPNSNREVNLKNAAAWETLTTKEPEKNKNDAGAEKKDTKVAGNSLWSEFQSREQQIKAREKSQEEQAEQMRLEREKAEEERQRQQEMEKKRKEKEVQERVDKERKEIEEVRNAEKAEILEVEHNLKLAEESRKVMKEQERGGNKNILGSLGLTIKEDDDDSFDEDEGDVEDGEL